MDPITNSVIIVGGGNLGAATALELKRQDPAADITLVDIGPLPNPRAASHDVSKIIRPDYADQEYMRIMAEVMPYWRTDPLYSPFYHEVGLLRVDPTDFGDRCVEGYRQMLGEHAEVPARWISIEETRALSNGVFRDASLDGVDKVLWNPQSGWAAADLALAAVIEEAISLGVKYSELGVRKLDIDEATGHCIGVTLGNGRTLTADKILLSAGVNSGVILADSAPNSEEIQAGQRIVATGAVSFTVKVDGELREKLRNVPVVKNCLSHTKGESMGMTPEGVLKFNCDISFTNMGVHQATRKAMSLPPSSDAEMGWTTASNFPQSLKERCQQVLKGSYGNLLNGHVIDEYRICWDATTPTHDFLICAHPHCRNLYIATGGSFHGWKFLPMIGKYIVRMLSGTLDKSLAERWAWDVVGDLDTRLAANPTYHIEADLRELMEEGR